MLWPIIFNPTHLLLPTRLWDKLVTPGNRVGLGFLAQPCPGPKSLGAGLRAKEGGRPGTSEGFLGQTGPWPR